MQYVYVTSDIFGLLKVFANLRATKAYVKWYKKNWPSGSVFVTKTPVLKNLKGSN